MTTIIETYGLTKNYGRTVAVNNLNLNIEEGTIFGYLGLNGAGKTTTISMLVGLVHPTRGLAKIAGYDVNAERGKALRNVGYLPERPGFYENLSAQDNLVYFGMLAGLKGSRLAKRTREVTEQVGLTGQERKKVRYYSHGMRQRLGLAIALLSEPSILILDEPTTGLDP
jgi:ABC-2 type transport system ATP-binding protein